MISYKSNRLQLFEACQRGLTHHSTEAAPREKGIYSQDKQALLHGFTPPLPHRACSAQGESQLWKAAPIYKAGTDNLFLRTHSAKHNRAPLSLPHLWTVHQQPAQGHVAVNQLCLMSGGSEAVQPGHETFGPQQESLQPGPKEWAYAEHVRHNRSVK